MAEDPKNPPAEQNPPGYVFRQKFWEGLGAAPASFKKGDVFVAPGAGEFYFVRSGVVAADVPRRGQSAQRLLFTRGMHFLPSAERGKPVFSALTNVRVYRLPMSALDEKGRDTVTDHLGNLDELGPRLMDAVKALFAQSDFGYLSTKIVLDLVKLEGIPVVIEAGSTWKSPDAGFVYLAEGEASSDDGRRLFEGSVHSDLSGLKAEKRCVLVYLPIAGIERFRRSSPALRRALKPPGDKSLRPLSLPHVSHADSNDKYPPQFVLLASAGVDAPLSVLTHLLAETVAEDFGSKTLVLTVTAGDAQLDAAALSKRNRARLLTGSVGIDSFRYDDEVLQREECDCVFLDVPPELRAKLGSADRWAPPIGGGSAPAAAPHRVKRTAAPLTTLVFVRDPLADLPDDLETLKDSRLQRVALLGGDLGDEDPAFLPRTIRLRLNLDEVRHLAGLALADVPLLVRMALSRLARAATDRQVGLALSGGGAWVFAHLALIEALHREGIPIDLVSGASGGSLVGAYYCALGLEGLARLRSAAGRMDLALLAAACSTRPLAWSVQLDLEGRRLRDLDVPLYPIVADLTNGVEFVPRRGGLSVAECVRASSTLVPIAASTDFEGRRCADGVFVNNTGERILAEEGADLLIASDVVQTPDEAPSGGFWDFVYRFRRIRDTIDANHLLVQSSDARDSFLADCAFDVTDLVSGPVGFASGRANERAARQQAETFVRGTVKPLWDRLRAP
jgi:predicted acylesterase/phospholipase RssA